MIRKITRVTNSLHLSPSQKTRMHFEAQGYRVFDCEFRIRNKFTTKDLFGILDFICIGKGRTIGVQSTSAGNAISRLKKIKASPNLAPLLADGWHVVLQGWADSDNAIDRPNRYAVFSKTSIQIHNLPAEECGSTVNTDCFHSYRGMKGYAHEAVKHSVGEYVRGEAHTNGVESFWALLKRGHYGVFHLMSPKHLHRYVNEFSGRHNLGHDTIVNLNAVTDGMVGRRLTYANLTSD